MVRSRLHIICGNCGCNDELSFQIVPDGRCDDDGNEHPAVYIKYGNCATLHALDDTIEEK